MPDVTATDANFRHLSAEGTETTWCWYEAEGAVAVGTSSDAVAFFNRRMKRPERVKKLTEKDVIEAVLRAALWVSVRIMPTSYWSRIARATSKVRRSRQDKRKKPSYVANTISAGIAKDKISGGELFDQYRRRLHERRIMYLREKARPNPIDFEIVGLEEFEHTQAEGRGAILWTMPYVFQSLAGKRGLYEAGLNPAQVSVSSHGFSSSKAGIRYLNTPLVEAENRYLSERIVLEREKPAKALRQAIRKLKSGRAVYFTNNVYSGRSFLQVPFGPSGWILMPQTPLLLARRYNFSLFTVETIELESFSRYRIKLVKCDVSTDPAITENEALAIAALFVRDEMIAGARENPDQFAGAQFLHRDQVVRLSERTPANE